VLAPKKRIRKKSTTGDGAADTLLVFLVLEVLGAALVLTALLLSQTTVSRRRGGRRWYLSASGTCRSTYLAHPFFSGLASWRAATAAAAAAASAKLAEEKAAAEAAAALAWQLSREAVAALKAQRQAAAAAALIKVQREAAAAAKLAEEKAAAEAAAALKAQRKAARPFSGLPLLALWGLGVGGVSSCGTKITVYQLSPGWDEFQCAAVHRVVNPVLQTRAYERKKEELAARLGAANVNEQFLFHGTSLASSEAIIRNNFYLSKVRTQSRCRCCVFVVIESLSLLLLF
jgi:hypothetical protein